MFMSLLAKDNHWFSWLCD